ncbi:DUF3800 domain-containing protein [Calidithermus roseus]|uniref:DUF3800 domain-containing protein n=1 Tax=Calidithermus roseus TaxID=1644118 RepID=A0A399ECT9_9DEIN|nr:DUF3800 domain-containing protein [Calidithermus roseus]RIH81626.1 hypothetical protein Mrose_03562 [Calidithermus roseus]
MLLFLDESGTDRKEAPYEVLAGVAVDERRAWRLIEAVRAAQLEHFGVELSDVLKEFKGSQLLHRKKFRLAAQLPAMDPEARRERAQALLEKGKAAREAGAEAAPTRAELTAYAQACLAYAEQLLELCARHRARVFASVVDPDAPHPAGTMLRKDFAYLFERFFYSLEDGEDHHHGLVVFDELDVTQSRRLSAQMARYFRETRTGHRRSRRILPEPFFVHSDLTTLVQVADLVAYCLNWGWRLPGKMTRPTRPEIEPYGQAAARLAYRGRPRKGRDGRRRPVYGICYLEDLRPRLGKKGKKEKAVP